jgi:hypothetical protein
MNPKRKYCIRPECLDEYGAHYRTLKIDSNGTTTALCYRTHVGGWQGPEIEEALSAISYGSAYAEGWMDGAGPITGDARYRFLTALAVRLRDGAE